MGKLAQRLSDPMRSGVYRVETTEAVEEAAALNGYRMLSLTDGALPETLPQVVLLRGRPGVGVLAKLEARAKLARERGECFFAVCVDPENAAPSLAPLYRWKR